METEIKKRKHRKGGTDYAKEKLAKAEAKIKELEKQLNVEVAEHQALEDKYEKLRKELNRTTQDGHKQYNEQQESIHKQAAKISELTAEIANLRGTARDYRCKFEEAVRRMGWLRRWWYEYDRPQFTDEDHWHD